jgi:hypothetical protein
VDDVEAPPNVKSVWEENGQLRNIDGVLGASDSIYIMLRKRYRAEQEKYVQAWVFELRELSLGYAYLKVDELQCLVCWVPTYHILRSA